MNPFALRLALRELRGGLGGFRIFLICLMLGVGGIAAVGSIAEGISRGLAAEGRQILGGDAQLRFTYRFADDAERAFLDDAGSVAVVADLRSMIGTTGDGAERALAQVKAVDGAYPLYGDLDLGGLSQADAFGPVDGIFGLVTEPILAERLELEPGDSVRLGTGTFAFRGVIVSEPDRMAGGFAMGPRVLVSLDGLRAAGLMETGTVFEVDYRLRVPETTDLDVLRADFEAAFPEAGIRWRDHRSAAPGIQRFVDRLGAFLVLVGLAALAVGGVGVGAAVRGYLLRKTASIATLRTLGADAGTIFAAYLIQIGIIAGIGIVLGLIVGGGGIALLGPLISSSLDVPAEFGLYARPLVEAAVFGLMVAALFTLWPLAWLREIRAAWAFRGMTESLRVTPRRSMLMVLGGLLAALVALVVVLSAVPLVALGVLAGIGAAFALLYLCGIGAQNLAQRLSHGRLARRRPGLRLALGAIGAPGAGTPGVVLALGLGLGVLATIAQVDANMQRLITEQLPEDSPAFFFVDIQTDQLDAIRRDVGGIPGTEAIASAPMLRGVITGLKGAPAAEAEIDPAAAWVLRGDRGVSYAAAPPPGVVLTEGDWWAEDYSGPPLVSFAEEEGRELGLAIGDSITVNILGRPITAEVANFRNVEWRGLGINFLLILSPGALAGAPHTHIATVHASPEAEGPIMRETGRRFPNVTAIRVRDQIERVSAALGELGAATRWGALGVLVTGLAVLIGAAAAGESRRNAEAAILKVLGSDRAGILGSFALRSALLGAIAGIVALAWGSAAAWGVTTFVLSADFSLEPVSALAVVFGGAAISLAAGLGFAMRSLRLTPASVLRQAEG